jgi:hypothetical protein
MPGRRIPVRRLVTAAAVAGAAVLTVAGFRSVAGSVAAVFSDGPTSVPACSWPLRVQGSASREQAGLIRCYVRALATRDTGGLQSVADEDPPVRITGAQLWHAADARAGVATATFVPNQDDSAYVTVNVVFADGVSESVPILLANPNSAHSWRLQIGTIASPITNAPPPASPDPPAS